MLDVIPFLIALGYVMCVVIVMFALIFEKEFD